MSHVFVEDLRAEAPIPQGGILSRTLYQDEWVKVVLFAFDQGQELSEHTATRPAILQILQGEALLQLGPEQRQARAGAWVYMPAHLVHAVRAQTPLVLLLTLLSDGMTDNKVRGRQTEWGKA